MTSHYFTLQCDPRYRQGAISYLIDEVRVHAEMATLGYGSYEASLEWLRQQLEECRS
jgi:hypothetical protein